jgi:hypothetical protein
MKSRLPVVQFHKYLTGQYDDYKMSIVSKLSGLSDERGESHELNVRGIKLGEVYFNLFQLISVYNLRTVQNKKMRRGKKFTITTNEMMLDIVMLIDKYLEVCFP